MEVFKFNQYDFIHLICDKPLVLKLYHEITLFMNILFLRETPSVSTTDGQGSGIEGKTFFILKYKFQPHNIFLVILICYNVNLNFSNSVKILAEPLKS